MAINSRPKAGRPTFTIPDEMLPNQSRKIRARKNMTLKAAAEAIGVVPSTLSQYEIHGKGLGVKFRLKLADLYGVTYAQLSAHGKEWVPEPPKTKSNPA